MKRYAGLSVLMFLTACASTGQEEQINATKDFVEVNELEKIAKVRTFDRIDQHVLNDRYVILSTRREQYLLEYSYPCRDDPMTRRPRPDIRRDSSAIYAGSDTFRGCQIRALYPITEDQAEELKNIGEAPGE
ncbi:MAG: DUF6491 family protein [Gammaproteobacteria bacterium]|jgi:hypothetical protein|nr:DUF6491 family protein [Gammaproteobacteria bacterium]